MTQGNLNKIKNGKQALTVDNLRLISERYNVSADWILGLKDDREVHSIDLNTVDYRQVFLILDELNEKGTIEAAQATETVKVFDYGDEDDTNDSGEETVSTEGVDYDLLKVCDPVLSFLIRRRMMLMKVDAGVYKEWLEKRIKEYKGIPILVCDDDMKKYFNERRTGNGDGDWSTGLAEYAKKRLQQEDGENK